MREVVVVEDIYLQMAREKEWRFGGAVALVGLKMHVMGWQGC